MHRSTRDFVSIDRGHGRDRPLALPPTVAFSSHQPRTTTLPPPSKKASDEDLRVRSVLELTGQPIKR